MKKLLIILAACVLVACEQEAAQEKPDHLEDKLECASAKKYPNAQTTEKMVSPGYTGEMNNYRGDDTTGLDIKHHFKDGELLRSQFFHENGQVQEDYHFKCGSIHGEVKYYYESGKLKQVIPFKYGRREGEGFIYDSLGVMRQKAIFRNDSLIGEPQIFDENGKTLVGD